MVFCFVFCRGGPRCFSRGRRNEQVAHHVEDAVAGGRVGLGDHRPLPEEVSVPDLVLPGVVGADGRGIVAREDVAALADEFLVANQLLVRVDPIGDVVEEDPRELSGDVREQVREGADPEDLEGVVGGGEEGVRAVAAQKIVEPRRFEGTAKDRETALGTNEGSCGGSIERRVGTKKLSAAATT